MTPAMIKQFRAERGLSQQALAEKLGVDQATISRIENGAEPRRSVTILLRQLMESPSASDEERAA